MKTGKSVLSVFLVVFMLCTGMPLAFAAETNAADTPSSDTETSVEGASGFGYILNNLEQTNVDDTNSGCSILKVEMEGKTATVYFDAPKTCKLVVAVYDDANREHMLASGMTDVNNGDSVAEVEIDIDALPQYYFIKAFMLNEDLSALSSPFSFYEHTSAYEQFMQVTPGDFNDDRIVVFGENPEESFGALTENVVVPRGAAGMTFSYDENAGTYTFQNATAGIKALSVGDIVFYETDNDFVLAKVASVTISGNNVIIKEDEDISIDDAFDYVRFDEGGYFDDFEEENIETGEAIEMENFEYMDADEYDFNADPYATRRNTPQKAKSGEDTGDVGADVKGQILSTSFSIDYPSQKTTDPKEQKWLNMGVKVTGSLGYTLGASARLHWDSEIGPDYFEYKVELESRVEFNISVTGMIEVNKDKVYWDVGKTFGQRDGFPLGKTGFFRLYVKVYLIASISGKLDLFKMTLLQLKGAIVNSDNGYQSVSRDDKWVDTPDCFDWEIEFKFGLGIEFEVSPPKGKKDELSKKLIASISISVEGYLDLKFSPDDVSTPAHDCNICLSGPAKFCGDFDITVKLKIFKLLKNIKKQSIKKYVDDNGKFEMTLISLSGSKDLGACFLSIRNGKIIFGFGKCPHIKTAVTVYAYDYANNNQGIKDVVVSYNGTSDCTDDNGKLVIYLLPHKTYIIEAFYSAEILSQEVAVSEMEKTVTFTFNDPQAPGSSGAADGTGSDDDLSNLGTQGGIIQFGAYPQTKVTDSATISALNSLAGGWQSYGYYSGTGKLSDGQMVPSDYMQYCDVKYDGNKYRGVTFSQYRPKNTGYTSSANNSCQDENGYTTETIYWFKFEPLKWRVLDPNEGLVMCAMIIDSQAFNNYVLEIESFFPEFYGNADKTYPPDLYRTSSIRKWLVNSFYETAFSRNQQERIIVYQEQLDNSKHLSANTHYSTFNEVATGDRVFLLSCDDGFNSGYGFTTDDLVNDSAKLLLGTDYAKCQGLYVGHKNYSAWWLIDNAVNDHDGGGYTGAIADDWGLVDHSVKRVNNTDVGICPLLKMNLSVVNKAPAKVKKEANATTTYQFFSSTCVAGNDYIMLNLTGYGSDFALATNNLEYIDQLTADESGAVSGSFVPRNAVEDSTTLLIGDFGNGVEARVIEIAKQQDEHTHTYTSAVTTPATCTEPGVVTYTCVDGDDSYTEEIPALGHTDDNNDGHCDNCGEQMQGGDHCKYCGKIHNGGFFDKLTGFFHKIFAIFKR